MRLRASAISARYLGTCSGPKSTRVERRMSRISAFAVSVRISRTDYLPQRFAFRLIHKRFEVFIGLELWAVHP